MIISETHIAGAEELPQSCAHCGKIIALNDYPKPFPAGARVGVLITTVSEHFASYIAGANDSNKGCDR